MFKRFLPLVLAAACAGCIIPIPINPPSSANVLVAGQPLVTIAGHAFKAKVADTQALLTNWPNLWPEGKAGIAGDSCIILKPAARQVQKVWMLDIQQPLDFVWVRDGKVVDLYQNAAPCTAEADCTQYGPNDPIDYVVDLAGGSIRALGIQRGDPVSWSTASPAPAASPPAPGASSSPALAASTPASVAPRADLDPTLVGDWAVGIPGMAWQTGPNTTQVSQGGSLGLLQIAADGTYRWTSSGRPVATGSLERYTPRRDAQPGATYWKASNGEEDFYFMRTSATALTFYSPSTNLYAADGKRIGAAPSPAASQAADDLRQQLGFTLAAPIGWQYDIDLAKHVVTMREPASADAGFASNGTMGLESVPAGTTLEQYAWAQYQQAMKLPGGSDVRFGVTSVCPPEVFDYRLTDLPVYQASTIPVYQPSPLPTPSPTDASGVIPMFTAQPIAAITAEPIAIFTAQPIPVFTAQPIPVFTAQPVTPAPTGPGACAPVNLVKLRVTIATNGQSYTVVGYFWVKGSQGFTLTFTTLATRFAELEKDFDESAATVKLR